MKAPLPKFLLLAFLLPAPWLAAENSLTANSSDGAGSYNYDTAEYQVTRINDNGINVGRQGPAGLFAQAAVFPFQLPDFGDDPSPFSNAEFVFYLNVATNSPPDVDLYALPPRNEPGLLPSAPSASDTGDFYMGGFNGWPTDDATPGVVKIQDAIINESTPGDDFIASDSTANQALADFLNLAYDNGAGAGKWVFLRLSADSVPGGVAYYSLLSANHATSDKHPRIRYNFEGPPPPRARPFIWVSEADKPDILAKIANQPWAASLFSQLESRAADNRSSHQADRDAYSQGLPVDWELSPARYRTTTTSSSDYWKIRGASESRFNAALDAAILYYLTGEAAYAELAGDILHNTVRTLIEATPSTNADRGGWIIQNDFLLEARVTGPQLAVVYDFLYNYLQTHQVYDVQTGGMTDFAFAEAQAVFRQYYELARDRGYRSHTNWHALMATCMLNNLLALDDEAERETALDVYLVSGTQRQKSLAQDYTFFAQPGNTWPESLQYAGAVPTIRSSHMALIDRYDPSREVFANYPNFPLSLSRVSELTFPNGQLIRFGDGPRTGGREPVFDYELIYQQAVAREDTALAEAMGGRINAAIEAGNYNRSSLSGYSPLGRHNEPLKLLWAAPEIPEPAMQAGELPRSDRLPFAGITLQRNFSPLDEPDYGLMGVVGGAGFVHSHASGMSIELYGLGQVLGAKGGRSSYGSALHDNYYRTFAANNTMIVNGGSRGQGGWQDIAINTVQNVAMEPQPKAAAVSPHHSFSVSSFADNKGSLANATQQRTLALVRTSATSGFYVDFFRSQSSVTSRTATTLDGPVTDQYHDYIYRNVGELDPEVLLGGAPAQFTAQPTRFQNDIGDSYQQPGWRYFENTQVTHPGSQAMRTRFVANTGGAERCMTLHMPAVAEREVALVESPPIVDAPAPYASQNAPALVIRQIGEAWDKPFAAVYEPHFDESGGTVQNVTHLERDGVVVGVKVESLIQGVPALHYVIAHPEANQTFEDPATGFTFTGRFGIAADRGNGFISLYLGEGAAMSYRGRSITTDSGSSSQAEVRFVPSEAPDVSAHTAVTVDSGEPVELWRFEHFGSSDATGQAAPESDPDGDGYTNAEEYTLGTDPLGTDPLAPEHSPFLQVQATESARSIDFFARAAEGSGYEGLARRYTVEYSENLSAWEPLPGATSILGANQPVTIELPADTDTGFCRIRAWLDAFE